MADTGSGAEPVVVDVTATLQDTLLSLWHDTVAHSPFIIMGLVVVMLTWAVATLVQRFATRLVGRWRRESLRELVVRLIVIAVWAGGLLLATLVVFPGLTPARALGAMGLVSIAVGFAFKDIFENFFAGILILWRYPFERGDFIDCASIGIEGQVEDITVRNCLIRRTSGELIVVPNGLLFKNAVEILTNRPKRRVTIIAGVAYGEDVSNAVAVVQQAVEACASVDDQRPVQVFPAGFGSSSIDIEVAWWTDPRPVDVRRSRGEVVTAIKRELDRAGIEIPFPYRTLTFKEPPPGSLCKPCNNV